MKDEDIDLSDIPEITEDEMGEAVLWVDAKPVPEGKSVVGVLLDSDILDYLKGRAGEGGLHRLINETLRASMTKARTALTDAAPPAARRGR